MSKKQKALIIIVSLVVLIAAVVVVYINDYYHAENTAQQCISEPASGITVVEVEEGTYTFAPNDMEPQAGVIFYPGGKVEAESYAPLMEALAERGIAAILTSMPGNLAVLDIDAAKGLQEYFPEVEEWYMAGHSLGGSMAASYVAENTDDYEGLILLASYSTEDLSGSDLRVLSIYGDEDKVLDMEKYFDNEENLPENFEEHIIEGGCHAYFGNYGDQDGDGTASIAAEEQIRITADLIAVFTLGLTV